MFKKICISSLIIVGLAFWIFSSKAGAATYFTENGSQISETEYEALCVKKIEDIQELEHILNGDSPKNPGATKLLVAESSANEKKMRMLKKMRSMTMKLLRSTIRCMASITHFLN
jgi:hypothetical protein